MSRTEYVTLDIAVLFILYSLITVDDFENFLRQ
jgi:hypothetical protein